MARLEEIETLKRQRNLPLASILDAQDTYESTRGGDGAPPITLSIDPDHGSINVSSPERLDSAGEPSSIPMTITKSNMSQNGQLNELWMVGNFMQVPLYQLKLSKNSSDAWKLEVVDFASKDSVDELLPR